MTEEFLHYIWKHALFDRANLKTTENKKIEFIQAGLHNFDSGPDFLNAQLRIDNTLWAGNVEIHIHSSDWNNHKHQYDKAYGNVILHVVWEHDQQISLPGGYTVQTLELKDIVTPAIHSKYEELKSSSKRIPCENEIDKVSELNLNAWLDRLIIERLERKTGLITTKLEDNINDWEETFYQVILRNLGNPINTEPFERFAQALPYRIIAKHRPNVMEIEALLLGQAGLLEGNFKDEYVQKLQQEYKHLQNKYTLKPITKAEWKFMRIRPPHFPSFRLAQMAAILSQHGRLFRQVMEAENIKDIVKIFSVKPSGYWQTHYRPDKESPKTEGVMGKGTIEMLIINAIAPLLFIYGKNTGNEDASEKALDLLHKLKAESNTIIAKWETLGIHTSDAYDSQALLQLRKEYCDKRRCIQCAIGHQLMKVKR
ncbi:MAG TPA: DUF2851 family protein [Bacteroidia bacterium]|jgi:hypothetical protein|nr:DUF2851 family protein [Bacteroidia bacterium]